MPSVFVPAANTVRVEMVFSVSGQIVENVYHVAVGALPTPTIMNSIAAVFKTWWVTNFTAMEPNLVSLNKILVTDLSDRNAPGVEYVTGLPALGSNVTGPAPMNVTVAVKWTTGNRGRSFRGRTYHIQLRTDQYVQSQMSVVDAAGLATQYGLLITAVSGAGYSLAIVSTRANKVYRTTALVTFITGVSCERTIDSQRRRLPGRGK